MCSSRSLLVYGGGCGWEASDQMWWRNRGVWLGVFVAAAAGVAAGLVIAGAGSGRQLPPARARAYGSWSRCAERCVEPGGASCDGGRPWTREPDAGAGGPSIDCGRIGRGIPGSVLV